MVALVEAPALLTLDNVHDFCDRTITVAPDAGFALDLMECYQLYTGYAESIGTSPVDPEDFFSGCQRAFPHSYQEIGTAYYQIKPKAYLMGLNYVYPNPWKKQRNKIKYDITKTQTGNIDQVNRKLANDNLPTDIPEYWPDFARLCKIKSGTIIVSFSPFDYQVEIYELMCKHTQLTIVKSRQLGITQNIISVFLHRACLNEAYTGVIFLKNKDDTSKIARRNRQMVDSLAAYITNESDSVNYFKITGGGDLHFMNSNAEGARSMDSVSDFLYDEAAFVPKIESIIGGSGAASAMVGESATQVVVSTPNTMYGWFYNRLNSYNPEEIDIKAICEGMSAETHVPFFHWVDTRGNCKIILHWKAHPVFSKMDDFVAYRQKIDDTTDEVAQREYNLAFVNSAVSIFEFNMVMSCMIGNYERDYDPLATYYMGIDTAGWGQNYTVAYVGKEYKVESPMGPRNAYKIVATYRANHTYHDTDMIAICDLINKWHPARVAVETNEGTGQITYTRLVSIFPELDILRICTSDNTKPIMVARLKTALQEKRLLYPKSPLPGELAIFSVLEDGKMGAPSGKNDDCVIAAGMLLIAAPFDDGDYRLVQKPRSIDDSVQELVAIDGAMPSGDEIKLKSISQVTE